MPNWLDLLTIEGHYGSIVALSQDHHDDLVEAASDGELYRAPYSGVPEPEAIGAEIEQRLAHAGRDDILHFAVIDKRNQKAVGMISMSADPASRKIEIGSTWYRKSVQSSILRSECKFLLIQQAFEPLLCASVELRTHISNMQSRKVIEQLGGRLEGIFLSDSFTDGPIRNTAVYSIISSEWRKIKTNIRSQLVQSGL